MLTHREDFHSIIAEHFGASPESPKTILYVPYALKDGDGYAQKSIEALAKLNIKAIPANSVDDPVALLDSGRVDGVYISGGNTFRLIDRLQKTGLLKAIKKKVEDGMPFMGSSAGSNVAGPTVKTTNDMPIIQPESFDAMNLVPFQINPHYPQYEGTVYYKMGDEYVAHSGETRADRINEFHEENKTPVVGLKEGSALRVTGDKVELLGGKSAKLFQQGKEPIEIEDTKALSALMGKSGRVRTHPGD
jgi:dipeptidase E